MTNLTISTSARNNCLFESASSRPLPLYPLVIVQKGRYLSVESGFDSNRSAIQSARMKGPNKNINKYLESSLSQFSSNYTNINKDYVEQFFIGLLEGEGTITVDQNKPSKYSRSRIFISLKNNKENQYMLELISHFIGGKVKIERKSQYVTLIFTTKIEINNCLELFKKYPLLSSRKICQLEFMKNCIVNRDVNYFLNNRDSKYNLQPFILKKYNKEFILPNYFGAWLSGFIEAEGSFSMFSKYQTKTETLHSKPQPLKIESAVDPTPSPSNQNPSTFRLVPAGKPKQMKIVQSDRDRTGQSCPLIQSLPSFPSFPSILSIDSQPLGPKRIKKRSE